VADGDLYSELGCSRTATQAELRASYKQLVRKFHPDLYPDDPEIASRFQRITAAYDVLGDERKRRQYDLHGRVAIRAGFDPDRVRAAQAAEAAPLPPMPLAVSFVESVRGGSKRVDLDGDRQRRHGLPPRVEVRIPPGLENGHALQIAPRPPAREPLLIKLTVAPHPLFRRSGADVRYELPITVKEAMLGHSLMLPTPRGTVPFDVPPGVRSGAEYRVRGHGVAPHAGRPGGDLHVTVRVVLPEVSNGAVIADLLDRFDQLYTSPVRTGWFQTADLPAMEDESNN
jgi:DnaJ-class molecular chaperone